MIKMHGWMYPKRSNVVWQKNKYNHENTHEVSVQDKSEKHENFHSLFRGFVLS